MNSPQSQQNTIFRWDALEPGSVQTFEQLCGIMQSARSLFAQYHVIEVPRGVINHSALNLQRQQSNLVPSEIGGATPHSHDWPVALVSSPSTATSTLVFLDVPEVARQAVDLAQVPESQRLCDFVSSQPLRAEYFHGALQRMRDIDATATDDDKAAIHILEKSLNRLSMALGSPDAGSEENTIYRYIAELQRRLVATTHEARWEALDMVITRPGVVHARSVKEAEERVPGKELYAFSMVQR